MHGAVAESGSPIEVGPYQPRRERHVGYLVGPWQILQGISVAVAVVLIGVADGFAFGIERDGRQIQMAVGFVKRVGEKRDAASTLAVRHIKLHGADKFLAVVKRQFRQFRFEFLLGHDGLTRFGLECQLLNAIKYGEEIGGSEMFHLGAVLGYSLEILNFA